jgi:hypothetical protein
MNEPILYTELFDVNGRKIFTDKNVSASKKISVAQLPLGIYLLRAFTKDGWSSARVVKQ